VRKNKKKVSHGGTANTAFLKKWRGASGAVVVVSL